MQAVPGGSVIGRATVGVPRAGRSAVGTAKLIGCLSLGEASEVHREGLSRDAMGPGSEARKVGRTRCCERWRRQFGKYTYGVMTRPMKLEDLYARPGFLLRRAHQIAVGIFVEECAAYRLTPPQHSTLIVIGHCPGIDQAALARAIGFDRATIGHVVGGLEARGLLRRRNSLADKRRKTLVLTPQGHALMRRAAAAIERTSERLLAPLNPNDRRTFVGFLLQLAGELNESSRSPVTAPAERGARQQPAAV